MGWRACHGGGWSRVWWGLIKKSQPYNLFDIRKKYEMMYVCGYVGAKNIILRLILKIFFFIFDAEPTE